MDTIKLQVKEAKGIWEKGIGLINKKPTALLFHTRFGIHTFGMRYPIDVVVLDKRMQVVKKKERLCPNRIFIWNPKYATVIEMPEGTIQDVSITIGSMITVVYL